MLPSADTQRSPELSDHAAYDVHELRDLMDVWRDARRTALQTLIKAATTDILALLLVGAATKLKVWGGH